MLKTFFYLKRGDHLTLGSLPDRVVPSSPVDSPRPFFIEPSGTVMSINPLYKDVPFLQEKLTVLKKLIKGDQATISAWESSDPGYPLLYKVKEQLARNSQMFSEITGDSL